MSDYSLSDRVELSEALRSILDDPETEEEKENFIKMEFNMSPRNASPRIQSCITPINKRAYFIKTTGRSKSVLTPSKMPQLRLNNDAIHDKRKAVGFASVQSPPKKRRHANQVIILRQPRSKQKQPKASPKPSTNTVVHCNTETSESQCFMKHTVKTQGPNKEFTVELETGTAGSPQRQCKINLNNNLHTRCSIDSQQRTLSRSETQNNRRTTTTPPRSSPFATPGSTEKYLEAAIETQIKLELTDEELESGLPDLDGLDPTSSPLCHFTDSNQQQLYSELSALDDGSGVGMPWPPNQDEALQLAANQQLMQFGGKFYFGDGQQFLQAQGPNGTWVKRGL